MPVPAFLRTYKTEKFIKVDVPRVGYMFRGCQFGAALVVLAQLYFNDGWANSEQPSGISNAWDEPGSMLQLANTPGHDAKQLYCNNVSWSYLEINYEFATPQCYPMLSAELTRKSEGSIFYTTSMLETVTRGWPCDAVDDATLSSQCTDKGGARYALANGQCGCVSQEAQFPLAVEDMVMAFEHSYTTTAKIGLADSSASVSADMYSEVLFGNGSSVRFGAGEVVRFPVREWLVAANLSLDMVNTAVRADGAGNLPKLRTSGTTIRVDIVYSNADVKTGRAVPGKTSVHANIKLTPETGTWTGAGIQTVWVQYPTLPRNQPQYYHLVERKRQGILFTFHLSGLIYKWDWFYLLSVALSGLVLLKFANTITNFYAFNCLGAESVVLRNKRMELVSKKSEFAEIGMKAALAASTYPKFDRFCDGTIEAEDIVRAFAAVEGVTWETAFMIARNILQDADNEPSLEGEVPGLNFVEFMTCLEGDAINFEQFLKDTRAQFDQYMLEDEQEDLEKGKKPAAKTKEPSMKEKLKMQKAAEEKKKAARLEKLRDAEARVRSAAKAAGKDYEEYMKERIEEEDDALRERCKKAYEEEVEVIKKAREAAGGSNKQAKKPAEGSTEPAEKSPPAPEGTRAETGDDAKAKAESAPPQVGPALEQSDEEKRDRLAKGGTLTVHVASASGLAAADKNGLADPYVLIKRGKKNKQTKVIKKSLDPSWDEDLIFPVKVNPLSQVIKAGLVLEVKDKDGFLDADDVMGTVNVDLAPLEASENITFCESISTQGVLKFKVTWEVGDAVASKKQSKAADEAPTDQGSKPDEPSTPAADTAADSDEAKSTEKKKKKKKEKDAEGESDVKQNV